MFLPLSLTSPLSASNRTCHKSLDRSLSIVFHSFYYLYITLLTWYNDFSLTKVLLFLLLSTSLFLIRIYAFSVTLCGNSYNHIWIVCALNLLPIINNQRSDLLTTGLYHYSIDESEIYLRNCFNQGSLFSDVSPILYCIRSQQSRIQ